MTPGKCSAPEAGRASPPLLADAGAGPAEGGPPFGSPGGRSTGRSDDMALCFGGFLPVDKVTLTLSASRSLAGQTLKTGLHSHRSLACRNSREFFPCMETCCVSVR